MFLSNELWIEAMIPTKPHELVVGRIRPRLVVERARETAADESESSIELEFSIRRTNRLQSD